MTSQGTAHGRFQRAIRRRHLLAAEIAARELGELSLADALKLCLLLADIESGERFSRPSPLQAVQPGELAATIERSLMS